MFIYINGDHIDKIKQNIIIGVRETVNYIDFSNN